MGTFVDYYKLLGISVDATQREVRVAYVRMAKMHHPDVGGSHAQMQQLNRAYGTLVDDAKRIAYDKMYRMERTGMPDAYRVAGSHQAGSGGATDMSDDEIDDFLNAVYAEFASKPAEPPLYKKVVSVVREQLRKRQRKENSTS